MSLERFHKAQDGSSGNYATALSEIRKGGKSSHWIWYVFPQLDGLGRSAIAQSFALRDLDEACAYLQDPLLGARYEEIAAAVDEQLAHGIPVEVLMGGSTDAFKLASSLTLFRAAASSLARSAPGSDFARLAERCDRILQRIAPQGYAACQFTIEHCTGQPPA